jgi:tRNA G18 (ribose-2'-O)-methylase SpoU
LADNLNSLSHFLGASAFLPVLNVILPVGISFYTFHTMSYIIDAYRGTIVPTKNFSSMQEALLALKKLHFRIIGFETSSQSESLYEKFQLGPTAFLFGNERFGLEPDILKECDEIRVIPGYGRKNSLNVAVSVGIACSEWVRQCL